MDTKSNPKPGQAVPFHIEGASVTYEGRRRRKLRIQLENGRLFRETTVDLNLYSHGTIEWHDRHTGTSESNQFGCLLSWLGVDNLQFCGMSTIIVYLETEVDTRETVTSLVQVMLDQAEQVSPNYLP